MKFLVLLLFWMGAASGEECLPTRDYTAVTRAITENFYDKTFKGLPWEARVAFYREQVKCSDTPAQVAEQVNALLAELNTSHTHLYTQQDLDYWGLKSVFGRDLTKFKVAVSGIWAEKIDGQWYAKFVLEGSPAQKAGVRAGDKLVALDGAEFRPMGFARGKTSTLELSHDGVKTVTVKLRPVEESVQTAFLTAAERSEKIVKVGGKRIGYFHLWCGTHSEFQNAQNAALIRFKKAKVDGLILDYRDGYGGANPEYLELLLKDPVLSKLPKVFLINEGVRSGKEWLSAIVKRDNLGKLIGKKTAGAFIAGAPIKLEDDRYFLYLAVKEFTPPEIPKLEGVGVPPDLEVQACQKFCDGKDLQLERALNAFGE